ncbi:AAA family ATPase [Actinomycetospora lutea]|uniref:AAA family ATPase n=1 Tax=Actinomycetospora lutea TaxID=663604 RepID=UPI002366DECB|nr:LuxR family transcriptional regulator [Actinomycetospora lutea]MDD7938575.1 AAA family ATPase [Actinomycetospora lutea]
MTTRPDPAWSRRAVTGPVFVGRRGPLAEVDQAWEDARAGRPAVVWVEGEAGAGKTAFLARAAAGRRAAAVLTATGDAAESALAHGLLDQVVAGLPPGLLDRFPLLRPDRAPRADPLAVGADLLGALGAVPDDDPVLVVLDDVQWADPASVRALVFALRRLRHDRVLVLAGIRHPAVGPGDADEGDRPVAPRWWERLPATGDTVRRVRLEGLDPGELSELAAALGRPLGSTGAAERLWRHTRGHPLHARTLLEELPPEVLAGTADVLPAPRSLPSVLLVRLSRAAPGTEALVVAAAVLGESAPLALAAAVAGLDDPSAALDEGVGLGLVEELPGGPPVRIGFVHPLVRAAVRGDLPPARRRALHAAAAARLAGRAALDHRIAAAAGPDPALASEIEELVAAPGALAGAEAADLLRAASELSTAPDDRERRLLAATSRLIGDGEIGRAVALADAVEGCRPGPWRSAVLGQLALFTGRFGVAREWFEAALATEPSAPGEERPGDRARAGAAAHLAILHLLHGDPERAVATAGVALSQGARGADVRLPGGLALVLGLAALGRGADARAVLDRASAGDGRPPLVDAVIVRGVLAALAGDDPAAAVDLDEAVQRARAGEPVRGLALALAFRPAVADRTGAPDGVVEGFELAVTLARDGGTALPGAFAHAFAAEALAVRGRTDEARAHLAAAAASGPRWWGIDVCAAIAAARLAEVSDDPAGVLEALAPTRDPGVRALADGLGMLAPRVLEIEALLALGRTDEADAALAGLEQRAAGRHRVDAARLRLCRDGGRPRSVAELGVDGVAAPHALARLETEIGRRLLAGGERRAGVDLLRGARDTLARLGAAPWRARCESLLHGAGLTPAATDEALGLTPHEKAVVALVARGLTNREIGQDLYITPRTVAYHLSNVYAKLGIASRRELVRLRHH